MGSGASISASPRLKAIEDQFETLAPGRGANASALRLLPEEISEVLAKIRPSRLKLDLRRYYERIVLPPEARNRDVAHASFSSLIKNGAVVGSGKRGTFESHPPPRPVSIFFFFEANRG